MKAIAGAILVLGLVGFGVYGYTIGMPDYDKFFFVAVVVYFLSAL